MRYRGWMLVLAGLMAAPQVGVSGESWPGRYADAGSYAPVASDLTTTQRYRPYAQTRVPAYPYPAADRQRPASTPQFRYRPWEGPAPRYPQPATATPGWSMPSYWGGVPSASTPPDRFRPVPASPYRLATVPDTRYAEARRDYHRMPIAAGAGAPQRYRFRPQDEAPVASGNGVYRYHALPMQIPDHYVYRPLNPVAKASRVRPAPMPDYAYRTGYEGWNRYAAQPYRLLPPPPWPYQPAMAGPWPTPEQAVVTSAPAPWWTPPAPGYPPAYVFNGYRPSPSPNPYPVAGRQAMPPPAYNKRYARRWSPPSPPPGYTHWQRPTPPMPYPARAGWERTAQLPAPPPVRVNRYGTDWYDGQGDGEGAWYRLTLETAPTLTQSSPPQPSTSGEWRN